jgi:shikimate kinase
VDTDRLVEEEAGLPLAEVWALGDFREREAAALGRVLAGPPAVVAAGGGAVLWAGFLEASRGWAVVWLDAAPEVLARRIRADARTRPSLTGRAADEEIGDVARGRAPLYAAAAWTRVLTDRLGPDALAEKIEGLLRAASPPKAD